MTAGMRWLACAAIVIAMLAYLRDPPWVGRLTSGLRSWEEDPPGTFFRWTNGRASFFVPAEATELTLPLRAVFSGPGGGPTMVDVRSDDRWLATIALPDPAAWERPRLPLGRPSGSRRYRRIDLRVNRVVGPYILGVMTGEILVDGASISRHLSP
jgi:hypothetical protein